MQGSNGYDHISLPSRDGILRRSNFLSESEAVRKERDFDEKTTRKLVSASTFLQPNTQTQLAASRRISKHATDLPIPASRDHPSPKQSLSNNNRALSYRSGEGRQRVQAQSSQKIAHEDFNSHLVQLKMQEMAFKFKSRIGTLLKEISIPLAQLARFTSLAKIDDILTFLSEKVKERLVSSEISENNVTKIRSKERELLADHEGQIESLRKRLQEKEALEKTQKAKIKQNHTELRELYDKLNLKEKELSSRITELYQSRTLIKQNEKLIQTLQARNAQLEKERDQLRDTLQDSNKNITNNHRATEQENEHLKADVEQLREALEMAAEKEIRLVELNRSISEEVARWRERFEEEREKGSEATSNHQADSQIHPTPDRSAKSQEEGSGIRSPADLENARLLAKNQELQSQIKRLSKQMASLFSYKQKYQNVIALSSGVKSGDSSDLAKIENMKTHSVDLYRMQIETYYNKKMDQMAKQWRDKLVDLVDSYTAEEEKLRQDITQLEEEKKALEKKVFVLANQKYLADCKVIEKQSEIYQITRQRNSKLNPTQPDTVSEELLISTPEIQPLQESIQFNQKKEINLLKDSKETYSIDIESKSEA